MINEAKVCGCSVLAVRVSGVEEQLVNGVNGWIVENTETAITDGLRTLLENPARIGATTNTIYSKEIQDDKQKIDRLEDILLGHGAT